MNFDNDGDMMSLGVIVWRLCSQSRLAIGHNSVSPRYTCAKKKAFNALICALPTLTPRCIAPCGIDSIVDEVFCVADWPAPPASCAVP